MEPMYCICYGRFRFPSQSAILRANCPTFLESVGPSRLPQIPLLPLDSLGLWQPGGNASLRENPGEAYMKLKVKKLEPDAHIPTRAKPGDSGLDLRLYVDRTGAARQIGILPGETVRVRTGIAIELPRRTAFSEMAIGYIRCGYEAQVRGRSGLTSKGIIACGGIGTVDNGYRGEIGVTLYNSSRDMIFFNHGDRIAQLVVCPVVYPEAVEVDELSETERGTDGFGSTGV